MRNHQHRSGDVLRTDNTPDSVRALYLSVPVQCRIYNVQKNKFCFLTAFLTISERFLGGNSLGAVPDLTAIGLTLSRLNLLCASSWMCLNECAGMYRCVASIYSRSNCTYRFKTNLRVACRALDFNGIRSFTSGAFNGLTALREL